MRLDINTALLQRLDMLKVSLDGRILGYIHDSQIDSIVDKLRMCKLNVAGQTDERGVSKVSYA